MKFDSAGFRLSPSPPPSAVAFWFHAPVTRRIAPLPAPPVVFRDPERSQDATLSHRLTAAYSRGRRLDEAPQANGSRSRFFFRPRCPHQPHASGRPRRAVDYHPDLSPAYRHDSHRTSSEIGSITPARRSWQHRRFAGAGRLPQPGQFVHPGEGPLKFVMHGRLYRRARRLERARWFGRRHRIAVSPDLHRDPVPAIVQKSRAVTHAASFFCQVYSL